MNNDLISREALKKLLEEDLQSGGIKTDEFDKGYDLGIEKAIEMLDNAPTVEPTYVSDMPDDKVKDLQTLAIDYGEGIAVFERKRPKGEWIGNAFDEHYCNRCGHSALWEEEPDGYYEVQSRFCPNCGADMRGEEENETDN